MSVELPTQTDDVTSSSESGLRIGTFGGWAVADVFFSGPGGPKFGYRVALGHP